MNKIYLKSSPILFNWIKTQNLIFNSIKIEFKLLTNEREVYNPSPFLIKIQNAWEKKNLLNVVRYTTLYLFNFIFFYCFPFWVIRFCMRWFSNFKIWKLTVVKINFSVSEYRVQSKNVLLNISKETINFKIIISVAPLIFGISQIIYSKYEDQTFSYYIQKNLPGWYPSHPKIMWGTFEHIISNQLKKPIFFDRNLNPVSLFPPPVNLEQQTSRRGVHTLQIKQKKKFALVNTSTFNSFIKRVDFYSDCFLIKLNSTWNKQQKQCYIGIFPKQTTQFFDNNIYLPQPERLGYTSLKSDEKLNFPVAQPLPSEARLRLGASNQQDGIGNNWYFILSKSGCMSFADPSNWTSIVQNRNSTSHKFFISHQNWITKQNKNSTLFGLLAQNSLIKNYCKYFYSNLDEFPIKLNQKNEGVSVLPEELKKNKAKIQIDDNTVSSNEISGKNKHLHLKNFVYNAQSKFIRTKNFEVDFKKENLKSNTLQLSASSASLTELSEAQLELTLPKQKNVVTPRSRIGKGIQFKIVKINNLFNSGNVPTFDQKQIFFTSLQACSSMFSSASLTEDLIHKKEFTDTVSSVSSASLTELTEDKTELPTVKQKANNFDFSRVSENEIFKTSISKNTSSLSESAAISDQTTREINLKLADSSKVFQEELSTQFYTENLKPLPEFFSMFVEPIDFINSNQAIESVDTEDLPYSSEFEKKLISPKIAKDKSKILFYTNNLIEKNYQHLKQFLSDDFFTFKKIEDKTLKRKNRNLKSIINEEQITSLQFLEYYSAHVVEILQEVLSAEKNLISKPRVMSGYEFPDMTPQEVKYFLSQYLYHKILFRGLGDNLKVKEPFLKIEFSPTFVSLVNPNESFYYPLKIPILKLKYRPQLLQAFGKISYEGDGVLQDLKTKDVDVLNKKEIKKQMDKFLLSDNPLSDRRETFFGDNAFFPEDAVFSLLNNNEIRTDSENAKLPISFFDQNLKKTILNSQDKTAANPELKGDGRQYYDDEMSVLPSTVEFEVPYLDENQWTLIVGQIKSQLENQNIDKFTEDKEDFQISTPHILIRRPQEKPIEWPLNQLDYYFLSNWQGFDLVGKSIHTNANQTDKNFFQKAENKLSKNKLLIHQQHPLQVNNYDKFVVDKNLDTTLSDSTLFPAKRSFAECLPVYYHYTPYSEGVVHDVVTEKTFFGNIYQKVFTLYKTILNNEYISFRPKFRDYKNNSVSFRESWEPLTFHSWIVITQASFALLVFHILGIFSKEYGKELISYLLTLAASLGILTAELKDELELDETEIGFRFIKKASKKFSDIAGIDNILPYLGEIVWFLRNSGRSFTIGNAVQKGILLVGPPGTGKTMLVQAIAGEAEVPVIAQSASSLTDPKAGLGTERIQAMFNKARQIAPCIVFIDEIDTLGGIRENIIRNPMGPDELIESIETPNEQILNESMLNLDHSDFSAKRTLKSIKETEEDDEHNEDNEDKVLSRPRQFLNVDPGISTLQETRDKQQAKETKLNLLTQFLIELDGLHGRNGVIVIGATNRPTVLDAALTRPGRFDQILNIELPGKNKRIEIFKLYSKNLGFDNSISWDYLANRTVGFSAADLASAMNESSMKAILNETSHTIQTIEQGIELITNYQLEKPSIRNASAKQKQRDPFFSIRFAYYQAGKAVVHNLLLEHPSVIVLYLWPQQKNTRQNSINIILQKEFLRVTRRAELESRLIGLYAGKAAELLILYNSFWQSNLGLEELYVATSLIHSMITKWYFYSKNIIGRKYIQIFEHHNYHEIKELEIFDFFHHLMDELEDKTYKETKAYKSRQKAQKPGMRPWWQLQVTKRLQFSPFRPLGWYRIYLPDPEESERNIEWSAPDEYYHGHNSSHNLNQVNSEPYHKDFYQSKVNRVNQSFVNPSLQQSSLASVSSASLGNRWAASLTGKRDIPRLLKTGASRITWNNLYAADRDYIYHSLVLTSFNKAFTILDENRELLDYFAFYLLKNEIIRQHEITAIISKFVKFETIIQHNEGEYSSNQNMESSAFGSKTYYLKNVINKTNLETNQLKQFSVSEAAQPLSSDSSVSKAELTNARLRLGKMIVDQSWGNSSYRKSFRFLNFKILNKI
uniref:Cell division protein n=1 Tax=Edaphochlorella mirabilis TaxID=3083 RepID=A0A097KKN1_9CHLO|nr:cell division protein [Edaphochlorella mirabilis]AIT93733.1 cell division protein [Edaphochlorella mirabilis]